MAYFRGASSCLLMLTPEQHARQRIDAQLALAGWVVQDFKQLNLGAATGVAVREYPTATGPAKTKAGRGRKAVAQQTTLGL